MQNQDRVPEQVLPCKRTFGLPNHNLELLNPLVSFRHPKGAIGIVTYRA